MRMPRLSLLFLMLLILPGYAGPPRNIVLVSEDARAHIRPEQLAPLVAFVDESGKPQDEMFDGFLFFALKAGSGRVLAPSGELGVSSANEEDFNWYLDALFKGRKPIEMLDKAVDSLPSGLKARKSVIISIPYPEWKTLFLFRVKWVAGFIKEAVRRFKAAEFRNLDLAGFYWLEESIAPTMGEGVIKVAAELTHALGLSLYWIPYFGADYGMGIAKLVGFDKVMVQPNYAYRNVNEKRFIETEQKRKAHGFSVEFELAMYTRNRPKQSSDWRFSFIQYCYAALNNGWLKLPFASFYSGEAFHLMSARPETYPYYRLVYKLLKRSLKKADVDAVKASFTASTAPANSLLKSLRRENPGTHD